jgi:X-domain of DnaJ-containing
VEARQLQKRRVTRLALVLADRLQPHVKGDAEEAKEAWKREAADLCDSNHGTELVRLIGASYASCAAQFLGSLESGIGMPSIARWARKQRISLERTAEQTAKKVEAFAVGNAKEAKLQDEANLLLLQDATDEEAFERIGKEMLAVMWTRTAVDVASTIHEVSQMVLFDQDLNPETRKLRGHALEDLGQIFQTASCRRSDEDIQTQGDFERIAFYAVLETIRNQEMATRNASIVYVD